LLKIYIKIMNKHLLFLLTFLVTIVLNSTAQVNPNDTTAKTPEAPGETNDSLYKIVEKQAEFPGGMDAMFKYLAKNMQYPAEARDKQISGTVYVEFIVEKDGRITNVNARRSNAHSLLEKAAVKAVREMPNWIPAKQEGKNVRSIFILPIQFELPKPDAQPAKKETKQEQRRSGKQTE
jgi:TonB family protein